MCQSCKLASFFGTHSVPNHPVRAPLQNLHWATPYAMLPPRTICRNIYAFRHIDAYGVLSIPLRELLMQLLSERERIGLQPRPGYSQRTLRDFLTILGFRFSSPERRRVIQARGFRRGLSERVARVPRPPDQIATSSRRKSTALTSFKGRVSSCLTFITYVKSAVGWVSGKPRNPTTFPKRYF